MATTKSSRKSATGRSAASNSGSKGSRSASARSGSARKTSSAKATANDSVRNTASSRKSTTSSNVTAAASRSKSGSASNRGSQGQMNTPQGRTPSYDERGYVQDQFRGSYSESYGSGPRYENQRMNYTQRGEYENQNYYGPGSRLERWDREGREGYGRGISNRSGSTRDQRWEEDRHPDYRQSRNDNSYRNENSYRSENSYRDDAQPSRNNDITSNRDDRSRYERAGNFATYEDNYSRDKRRTQTNQQRTSNSSYYTGSKPEGKQDEGLRKLLTDQLKDMLWAEKALTKAIPEMIEKASSQELIDGLREHLEVTKEQVFKVKEAFKLLNEKPQAKVCEAMKGLVKEAEELMKEMEEGPVRDAAIICAAQKVEHYEIATYGCLHTYAEILGEEEVADLLEEIMNEEKEADDALTEVAHAINWEAKEEEEDEDEEEEEEDEEEEEEEEDEEDSEEEITGAGTSGKDQHSLWRTKHSKNPRGKARKSELDVVES